MLLKAIIFKSGEGKEPEIEVRCPHLALSGKVWTPRNCDKSHVYFAISRATTMKTTQRYMLKNNK